MSDTYKKVLKLFNHILDTAKSHSETSDDLQADFFDFATTIDDRWKSGGAMIADIDSAMSNHNLNKDFSASDLKTVASMYPYLAKAHNFKDKVVSKYAENFERRNGLGMYECE